MLRLFTVSCPPVSLDELLIVLSSCAIEMDSLDVVDRKVKKGLTLVFH